ncbi:hypothetical protein R3P38DRAFT_949007 [Favolaschia claudopus]|uniref:SnoaL-like domain-containing protein n=1 Tax=Favolaschia claudopus TaxID=2862362 RepID=A0AAW0BMV9_9AGAR
MTIKATLESKQLQNAHAFLALMSVPDFDGVAELLAPNFMLEFFPESLSPPGGKHALNGKETVKFFKRATDDVFEYIVYLPPLYTFQGPDAVVIHVKSEGMTKSQRKYENEYMYTFQFSGEKIVKLGQFVDSKYYAEFFGAGGVAAAGACDSDA